jgi:hypothetical protein
MLRAKLSHRGVVREIGVDPDIVFALKLAGGSLRNFMVEIDRGTMPVRRSDPDRTSFEGKMRVYLSAHAAKQHERQFGWKNFRVLVITTDWLRVGSMIDALSGLRMSRRAAPSLFLFTTFGALANTTPLDGRWLDSARRSVDLI